jgi:hypothetical protein
MHRKLSATVSLARESWLPAVKAKLGLVRELRMKIIICASVVDIESWNPFKGRI